MMLNTDECHAFVIGFFEVLCPWKPHYHLRVATPDCLEHEYHYYLAGRGAGFIALLLIFIGLAKLTSFLWR